MSYQALYRVWRPRTFEDVVGQTHITRTLQNAIIQEKFSHAYLFTGPRGTGKTSAAKIFAKTINCEHAPVKEPCNECAACRGIQDGSISDVIEIDAASNTSVDDIREIRDNVKYASSVVPYKVYIIDEVHMISVNAFNALLKTLEEPPKHVVFILATTEPHKIPLTIISRCQRFDFKPITNQSIVDRMQKIVDAEGVVVKKEALDAVALAAEGGMRDALSILDQAISYSENHVELDDVLAVTGGVSQKILTDIVSAMYKKDVQSALNMLDQLIQNGKDPARFVYDIIYFLRDLLLYRSAPSLEGILERAIVDEHFQQLATEVPEKWIQTAIMELNQCQQEMKWSNNPKVFIEIAIITISNRSEQSSGETDSASSEAVMQLTQKLAYLEKEITNLKQSPQQAAAPVQPEKRRTQPVKSKNSYKIPYERIRMVLGEAQKPALKEVQSEWANFLSKLKQTSAPAHATIQDSKPAAASDSALVVAFKYEIHCSLFLDNRELVESVLTSVLNKHLTIIPIPNHDWIELRNEYVKNQEPTTNKEVSEDPVVEEARKLFGDDLLEIHD
ncbi:DNA polymerase III subunit gamma/tau [Ornithinibacillus halotolerans]|uniref:DNA-directed DNA polymerase n=1 Tax=Ornithinibacillus halotolerans TaxID=1274357 RepID=A0A916RV54_9BACI|nr:DNA polymerase III subunit gamma/tau [Ornithinibacillus halotolerans]GGA70699.1 DNA polymerase III subunit gamma/tau [Ornithinibacillus halotolerans]